LDAIGRLFEILLTRILNVVGEWGLLQDEQFGFRPGHSTSLQLARLVERITRNFAEEKKRRGVPGRGQRFLYKLTVLNLPSYLVHTISSYLRGRTFEASFMTVTSSRLVMRAGVSQGGLTSPVLQYVNDMPTPSHHVEMALYADDTAITVTSRKSTLFVTYLESYLSDFQRCLE
jgi:hypothetical protein